MAKSKKAQFKSDAFASIHASVKALEKVGAISKGHKIWFASMRSLTQALRDESVYFDVSRLRKNGANGVG